jgi:hypothetical protein
MISVSGGRREGKVEKRPFFLLGSAIMLLQLLQSAIICIIYIWWLSLSVNSTKVISSICFGKQHSSKTSMVVTILSVPL